MEVKSILKSRNRGGGRETEYRVHWVGYDNMGDLTWEPESHLTGGAAEYLAAFKKKKGSSKGSRGKEEKKKKKVVVGKSAGDAQDE